MLIKQYAIVDRGLVDSDPLSAYRTFFFDDHTDCPLSLNNHEISPPKKKIIVLRSGRKTKIIEGKIYEVTIN